MYIKSPCGSHPWCFTSLYFSPNSFNDLMSISFCTVIKNVQLRNTRCMFTPWDFIFYVYPLVFVIWQYMLLDGGSFSHIQNYSIFLNYKCSISQFFAAPQTSSELFLCGKNKYLLCLCLLLFVMKLLLQVQPKIFFKCF
jgi:hypothetical protein